MAQNTLKVVADKLIASMERIEKCNDSDLENELKRGQGLTSHTEQIVSAAKSQIAMYISTGTLPADNYIFAHGEQIVTGGFIGGQKQKQKLKGLTMDEFNRP